MKKLNVLNIALMSELLPVMTEEERRTILGGCKLCEYAYNNGGRVFTGSEYDELEKKNNWKGGLVCGMGYVGVTSNVYGDKGGGPYSGDFCFTHGKFFNSAHPRGYCGGDPGMPGYGNYSGNYSGYGNYSSYGNYSGYGNYFGNYSGYGNRYGYGNTGGGDSSPSGGGSADGGSGEGDTVTTKADVELMNKDHFAGYDVTHDCMKGCKKIMDNYNVEYGDSEHVYRLLHEEDGELVHFGTDVATNYSNAIDCIDRHLDDSRPIIVGVNHSPDNSINEGTTDHFIVITGRGYDDESEQYYYTYMDPARYETNVDAGCSSTNNRLYYDEDNHTFADTTAGSSGKMTYSVVQVRPNDGQNLTETISSFN